jgi:predicted DNA-binding transcriptional regulator YafY
MNRIDRLFGMLTLLQSRKHMTAEAIADKFEISVRTVYRDIKALCEQGIPVGFEPHKGYGVVQGYFLPPVSFSTEEANALLLMEAIVSGFADKSIQVHYSTALSKVKAVLRNSQKEKLAILDDSIRIHLPDFVKNSYEYLSLIQNAISEKQILEMDYKNNNEIITSRQAEPIGLVFYSMNWHLIAWCHLRHEYRDFRVSRILKLRNPGIPFRKTDHIELTDFMKKVTANY